MLPQLSPQPQLQSDPTQAVPVTRRTRARQKTGDHPGTDDFTPPPLTPEEQKLRENNLSHMTHIKEAIKAGLSKWKEELKKDNDVIRQAWLESHF